MQSPGPNSKPPASTSTPAANGESAVSVKPLPSQLPVQPYNLHQRRPKGAAQACDLAAVLRGRWLNRLAEGVVSGGLHAQSAELQSGDMSAVESEMSGQKFAADWRYWAALRVLAVIRKLGVPAVQINIGEQQVNVSG
jgi:hypothetical protein